MDKLTVTFDSLYRLSCVFIHISYGQFQFPESGLHCNEVWLYKAG